MITLTRDLIAEALFVSDLQPSQACTCEQLADAAAAVIAQLGERGCAGCVAAEFGEHPDTAVARMRWARTAALAVAR